MMQKPLSEIKLIAIDIDGTLLTPGGQITPRTRAAIQAAREAGIIVTLATARRYTGAQAIATALGIELPLIVYDGALIVIHPTRSILTSKTLPFALARQTLAIFQEHAIQPIIHPCEGEHCVKEEVWTGLAEYDHASVATYLLAARDRTRRMTYELLEASATHALRIVAFAEEEVLGQMLPAITELHCSYNFTPLGSYQSAELAVLSADCSKASGLTTLAAHYNIALEQVMAIGDNYNDLEMLRLAGWGVAMGQAPEPVRKAAKAVTTTNQEDGVALAIERYALTHHTQATLRSFLERGDAALTSFNILP